MALYTPPSPVHYADQSLDMTQDPDPLIFIEEVKNWLRVNHSDDDVFLTDLVRSVTDQLERWAGIDFTVKDRITEFYDVRGSRPVLELPYGPHGDIEAVYGIDDDTLDPLDFDAGEYNVQGLNFKSIRINGRQYGGYHVEYKSGYTDERRPTNLKDAVKQEISLQYNNRQRDPQALMSRKHMGHETALLLQPFARPQL